jgi:hypothetical protein|tara:strand:+ start:14 stop:499 length:486 start_codon:yes stop_codon:yes gene_type:complete
MDDSYEYVRLDDEFCDPFREPTIIRLLSHATDGLCFKLGKPESRGEEQTHPIIRAFVEVASSDSTYCFPPNSPKMSINGFIAMSRFVENMVQLETERIIKAGKNATHVSARKLYYAQINALNRHQDRIRITTGELLRLRDELENGFCHGDSWEERVSQGGE